MRCPKCGKPITVTLPKKDWLHIRNPDSLEHRDKDTLTIDAILIFLTNSEFEHNVWICKECYDEWGKFHRQHYGKWGRSWNLWFNMKEVVLFT